MTCPINAATDAVVTAGSRRHSERTIRNVSAALVLIGTPIALAFAWRWGAHHQLGFDDAAQFLFFSTAPSAFRRQPRIMRLLEPATRGIRDPDVHVPADFARAVDELIRRVPSLFAPIADSVQHAVPTQPSSLAVIDRELALLAPDASPAEVNRLSTRLELRTEAESASPDHAELGETRRRELELMRRLQGQYALAQAHRARLLSRLQALWSQLRALVDAERQGETILRQAEQSVLALCLRMGNEGGGPDGRGHPSIHSDSSD